ncbi:MAG: S41 family peptidase [Firmicutes bacterium]|nr:S41 family peptidase [Bacillota bacterium]
MKKLLLFLLTFILVACNADIEPTIETNIDNTEIISERNIFQELLETANENWEFSNNAFLSIEDFSYDIDFLLQMLEENFPFIGVSERMKNNSNLWNDFSEDLSTNLELLYPLDSTNFEHFLVYKIFQYFNLAHLSVNPPHSSGTASTSQLYEPLSFSPSIIEENKIALIPIPPQYFEDTFDRIVTQREMQDFISKVQMYEHIILDFRNLPGGVLDHVLGTFISPNISEPLVLREFAFITGGSLAMATYEHARRVTSRHNTFIRNVVGNEIVSATEFAQYHNLININEKDLENLAYGFILETFVANSNTSLRLPFLSENIWVLINSEMYSAAAIFSQLSKEAGFILVGDTTGNHNSWGRAFFQLPKTGHTISMDTFYITDSTGRNIEEFPTEPHYFNRPEMDTLETVLAIIAEQQ